MIRTWVRAAIALTLTLGFAPAAIAQIYQQGSTGEAVERIQLRLGVLPIDGIYGPATVSAVEDFQQRRGLQVDGIAGPETLDALDLDDLIDSSTASDSARTSSTSRLSYVVVVPGNAPTLLARVRGLRPDASLDRSNRGSYIRAGSFTRRSEAERVSRQLRQSGLDARVAYRPGSTTAR